MWNSICGGKMSSEGATEHIAHFTVDGKGLTRICRQLYVFEQNEYGAIKILQWLHGITMDQIRSVCTGYARLEDQPDGTMKYVPESDLSFVKVAESWNIYCQMVLEPARQEKIQQIKSVMETLGRTSDEGLLQTLRYEIKKHGNAILMERGHPSLLHVCAERPHLLKSVLKAEYGGEEEPDTITNLKQFLEDSNPSVPESSETIEIGGKQVPKHLIDRYANHTVKRLRKSMRDGIIPKSTEEIMEIYDLELERQDLHDAICKAVGLEGQGHDHGDERTDDYHTFDRALSEYLDKHAGTIFNGEGD